jgi:hypothetical protein
MPGIVCGRRSKHIPGKIKSPTFSTEATFDISTLFFAPYFHPVVSNENNTEIIGANHLSPKTLKRQARRLDARASLTGS